ncbi:MAG TPA: NAD(P)-dependent oxidoreductase, partial [Pirellulales bacterium]|nr:NAD(P)-dependent oxidoreductase [Pirellulales bacterium]
MKIALTGVTGFLGHYLVGALSARHELRLWHRPASDRGGFEALADRLEWLVGGLGDEPSAKQLVAGCDAVV